MWVFRTAARVAAPALAALLVLSCGGDDGGTGPDPLDAVASVSVSPGTATIDIGATTQLQATVRNGRGEVMNGQAVTWTTSDPQRASVQGGLVTGLAEGPVTIGAAAGGRSAQATVTVNDPNPPASPGGLQVSPVSDTRAQLTWQDNADNEDEFRIERETVAAQPSSGPARAYQQVATVGAGVTSFLDQGLTPGTGYRYRVSACNENGCSTETAAAEVQTYVTLTITTTDLPDGLRDAAYSHALTATGGDGTVAWSLAGGTLPAGLALDAAGVLAGTPTEAGSFTVNVQAEGAGQSPTAQFEFAILDLLEVATADLPDGQVGVAYDQALAATGGDGTNTWSLTAGTLPPGLSLAPATGAVTGTPTQAGTYAFTVQVQSGDGQAAAANLSVEVAPAPVEVTTTSLPTAQLGVAYATTLQATGGDGSYTWSVTDGALPTGLSLDAGSGEISGTPGAAGTFDFTVEAASGGLTDDQALSLTVTTLPPVVITTTNLPNGAEGVAYSQPLAATGGDGSYTWSVATGALPGGVSLDPGTGVISGTPTAGGTFAFTVEAASGGLVDDQALSLTVTAPTPVVLETVFLRGGYEGTSYDDGVTASGGDGPLTFSVVEGALPSGLTLDTSTGAITGVPAVGSAGAHYLTIDVAASGSSAQKTYILTISTAAASAFNMVAHTIAPAVPSAAVQSALDWALARWEEVITGDIQDFLSNSFTSAWCEGYGPEFNGVLVDDLEILVNIDEIDGPLQTLGYAGPCAIRGGGAALTILGILKLDSADLGGLDTTQLRALFFHEIGHIVGIGTLWNLPGNELVVGTSGEAGGDPRYVGVQGVAAYQNMLGGLEPDIPVANTGNSGTVDAHWREATFNTEIMTGYSEGSGVPQPVSVMTIASLIDLGYTVDLGAADGYTLPAPPPVGVAGAYTELRPALDDILAIPLAVFMPDGRVLVVPARVR